MLENPSPAEMRWYDIASYESNAESCVMRAARARSRSVRASGSLNAVRSSSGVTGMRLGSRRARRPLSPAPIMIETSCFRVVSGLARTWAWSASVAAARSANIGWG